MTITLKREFPTYQSTLTELRKIEKPGIRLDLVPMRQLSAELKDPWRAFPSILVAGTNGKGSTCAILSEILSQAGYRVGVYTSPHLISYRERIAIKENGCEHPFDDKIWRKSFGDLSEAVRTSGGSFTEFELLTALAFLIFKEKKVDVAVVEVGLGGRLDATNVLEPILSIITTIGYDHQEYLGNTLSAIAEEKAGIFRSGRPGLSIAQSSEVAWSLESISKERNIDLSFVSPGTLRSMSPELQRFFYEAVEYQTSLIGPHQIRNASLAIKAGQVLNKYGFHISQNQIGDGVRLARWPARMERLSGTPAVFVDGAHNPDGCLALVATLKKLKTRKPHLLILGILGTKEKEKMLRALAPWGDDWIFTRSSHGSATTPEDLHQIAESLQIRKRFHLSDGVGEAFRQALSTLRGQGTLVITGSLTTAGEARRLLRKLSAISYQLSDAREKHT